MLEDDELKGHMVNYAFLSLQLIAINLYLGRFYRVLIVSCNYNL